MSQPTAVIQKPMANILFNNTGGRKGVKSAAGLAGTMLRKHAEQMGTIRPGPRGMGMVPPQKPTQIPSGYGGGVDPDQKTFSHLHHLHEYYNEK